MQSMQVAQAFGEPLALNPNNSSQKPTDEPAPKSPHQQRRIHKPAIFNARRRGRIARRVGHPSSTSNFIPRSGTLPDMRTTPTPNSAMSSLVSSTASAFAPSQARPATSTPTKNKGARPVPAYATPPRAGGKKKPPSFLSVFKSREVNTALPDGALSPKARKVLGLPAAARDENGFAATGSHESEGEFDDQYETDEETHSSLGRATWDIPTRTNTDNDKTTAAVFPYTPGPASESFTSLTKKRSNNKALRMLDLIPSFSSRPKSSGSDRPKSAGSESRTPSASSDGTQDSKLAYHSGGGQEYYVRDSRVAGKIRKRRTKRERRAVEHMSPIVERSSNSSRSEAELDIIREYGGPRRSLTMPIFPRVELNGDTLFEEDEVEYNTGAESDVHRDSEFARSDINLALGGQVTHGAGFAPAMIMQHFRGLSQQAEPEELMETEGLLLHGLGHNEVERAGIAAQHSRMREEHAALKAEFEKASAHSQSRGDYSSKELDAPIIDFNKALAEELEHTLKSDSDSGFESDDDCKYVAQTLSVMRVQAGSGMVKMVDIPRRRVPPGMVNSIEIPPKNPRRYEHPVDIDFAEVKALNDQYRADMEKEALREKVGTPVSATGRPSPGLRQLPSPGVPSVRGGRSPFPDPNKPYRSSAFAYAKEKKAKLPREESRNLVEGWIQNASTAAQRPVSLLVDPLRLDPDVLADQNLDRAPAPPPKDTSRPGETPKASPRHFCVHFGHIFRPIDLRRVPDDVAIGNLEVSPYLRTTTGRMQHVRIPVKCERCGRDVNERLYECEVPVCRVSVCFACAVDLQEAAERRAIGSWDDRLGD